MSEIYTNEEIIDILNRDILRVKEILRSGGDRGETGIIYGPKLCIKATRKAIATSYPLIIEELKKLAGGPRVQEIEIHQEIDGVEHYWGDYVQHRILMS